MTYVNIFNAALIKTSEMQHQRWSNFIISSCWVLVKALGRKGGVALLALQALCIIDTVLQSITTSISQKKSGEVCTLFNAFTGIDRA